MSITTRELGGTREGNLINTGFLGQYGGGVSYVAPKVINNGETYVDAGKFWFENAVTGTGSDVVAEGQKLEFGKLVGSGQTIDLNGFDTLATRDGAAFNATIDNFDRTDVFRILATGMG